jgi:4'-phosphopantetheinyl transferase
VLEEEFFTIWTMKEAVVKGIGSGIMASLQSFTTPEHATALAAVECGNATFSGWHTMSLGAPEGYRAAVATKSASAQVIVRPFRF